jgi:hypothetical protein
MGLGSAPDGAGEALALHLEVGPPGPEGTGAVLTPGEAGSQRDVGASGYLSLMLTCLGRLLRLVPCRSGALNVVPLQPVQGG